MMRRKKMLLLVLTVIMMLMGAQSQDKTFSTTLSKLIQTKNRMTTHMISTQTNVDQVDGLKKFINTLVDLKYRVEEFKGSPLDLLESKQALAKLRTSIRNNERKAKTDDPLFASFTLAENNNRRTWKLFQMISEDIAKSTTIQLPQICQAIGSLSYSETLHDLQEITITNICKDISSCPNSKTLYSDKRPKQAAFDAWTDIYKKLPSNLPQMLKLILKQLRSFPLRIKYKEQDVSASCKTNKQCDVKQALPMMAGILRYQINEMIFQRLCPRNCHGGNCEYRRTYQTVLEDIDRLISYAASLPSYWTATNWNSFYKDAVVAGALTNLNVAMSKVEDKKCDFEISNKQCNLIKFAKACPNGDLFKPYKLLKKIQQNRKNNVKVKSIRGSLTKFHLSRLLGYSKDDRQQMEAALGSIKKLDHNLQASVPYNIISIFKRRAESDKSMATYDVRSIKDELDGYEKSLKTVEIQLNQDVKETMTLMTAVVASNLTLEKMASISALIVTNSNPLKLIFSDTNGVMDILDQSGGDGAERVIAQLVHALNNLTMDSSKLKTAFGGNPKQIPSLGNVVKKIRNGQSSNIGQDADNFLEEYSRDYIPMTDRDSLAKNDALWSNFRNAICDVLSGEVGNMSGSSDTNTSSIAGGKLLCKRLRGTLGKFFRLRQSIFNFQFRLVDSVVAVVRGNIGQRFASSIKGKRDSLQASELMTGLFIVQYEFQKIASFHCDQLEYKNLGKPPYACSSVSGLFMKEDISYLVSMYKDTTAYDEKEQYVYIPTRARAENDLTGYVDLQALAKGDTVVFKIPVDIKWLQKHKWMAPGQTAIPFVQNFQLFLPRKSYNNSNLYYLDSNHVKIISIAGSSVTALKPNTDVVYVLPTYIYETEYEENSYSHCWARESVNPYSLCTNISLPKTCDRISKMSSPDAILPTVLSTWSIKTRVYRGRQEVDYDAPNPQTNLLLRARAVLRVPKYAVKHLSLDSIPRFGCCKGNTYRSSLFNRTCDVCPQGTTSFHGGLFCQ